MVYVCLFQKLNWRIGSVDGLDGGFGKFGWLGGKLGRSSPNEKMALFFCCRETTKKARLIISLKVQMQRQKNKDILSIVNERDLIKQCY